jgi:hypothetical protein
MLPLMVVKSPRCDEMVTLPAGLTPETKVRCPFSKEEFTVAEILETLPPVLEVLDGPGAGAESPWGVMAAPVAAAAVGETTEGEVVDAEKDEGGEDAFESPYPGKDETKEKDDDEDIIDLGEEEEGAKGLEEKDKEAAGDDATFPAFAAVDDAAPAGAFDFGAGAEEQGEDGEKKPLSRRPRPAKKKGGPGEIIKIVLGGIAGLAIAQAIIWWGMNKDPFKIAPYFGPLAPSDLREKNSKKKDKDDEKKNAKEDAEGDGRDTGKSRLASTFAETKGNAAKRGGSLLGGAGDDRTGRGLLDGVDDDNGGGRGQVAGSGDSNNGGNDHFAEIGDIPDPFAPRDGDGDFLGVKRDNYSSPQQIGDALKLANTVNQEWDLSATTVSKAERRTLAMKFYTRFCELAEHVTYADTSQGGLEGRQQAIKDLLGGMHSDAGKMALLSAAGKSWLNSSSRKNDGIVLVGEVTGIKSEGPLYRTTIKPAGGEEIDVYSKVDPTDHYLVSDRLIVLGAIVDDPAVNLHGYAGDAAVTVWGGLPIVLPAQ